jgi:glycosyltransferase involved in cell wall biosynthesis
MSQPPRRRMAYLALEAPRAGQAAATHVTEIVTALESRGWRVSRHFASRTGVTGNASYPMRLFDYVDVQVRAMAAFPRTDVLFVRAHFMSAFAALLAPAFGVVVVHEVNGRLDDVVVTYPGMARWLVVLRFLQRVQFERASHIFCVTDGLADYVRALARHERVSVVPNAANTAVFTPDGPAHREVEPYVIFVGSLAAWHGIDTLLASVADPAWPAATRLVMIGDGSDRAQVVACTDRRVIWLGLKSYAEIPFFLRGAIAALVPITNPANRSGDGVSPLKLYEAMACGVPVIATDLPFQADLVSRSNAGLLVPAGDAHAMAEAVATLRHDPERARQFGANAHACALAESWCVRAAAIDTVLDRLLARRD